MTHSACGEGLLDGFKREEKPILALHLLSRPHVMLDGEVVTGFVSDKALAMLCYLALNEGRQSREMLAGLLWGEMTSERASANLRVALHNLKQLLPDYVEATRKQVAFVHKRPHQIDVVSFEAAAAQQDPTSLAKAAALYKEDFLSGLYFGNAPDLEVWLRAEQERLRLQLIEVLERLGDHHSQQGRWREATNVIHRLLVIEPWRERSHRQLMLLLARQGKYSAALSQYEHCREVLAKKMNVAPMPETEKLYKRILRLRSKPRPNLPSTPESLVGRTKELEVLSQRLNDPACRLLTLYGPGGIGKTRLVLELGERHRSQFLEGTFYISLSEVTSPHHLPLIIGDAMDISFEGPESLAEQLLMYLREREVLLILDNFEQLLEGAAFVRSLLDNSSAVKALVASRVLLNQPGEWIFEVSGLSLPDPSEQDLDSSEAVQFFLQKARQRQHTFAPGPPGLQAIGQICRRLDGIPLAIEQAASWLRVLNPHQLLQELEQGIVFLTHTARQAGDRHQSMHVVLEQSWNFLGYEERIAFQSLSVFRGGFTRQAAEEVTGTTLQTLTALVDNSMLRFDEESGRYQMHELLHQFAGERLQESKEGNAVRDAHCYYYLSTLAGYLLDLKGHGQLEALDSIETDFENIRVAWRRASELGYWSNIAKASESLHLFTRIRSRYLEGVELFEVAQHSINTHDSSSAHLANAYVTSCRQALLDTAGLSEEALTAVPEMRANLESVSDPYTIAFCNLTLGEVLYSGARFDEAFEALDSALDYFQKTQENFYAATTLLLLGWTAQATGQSEKALDLTHHGLTLARQEGDHYITAALLITNGKLIRLLDGPTKTAENYFREAVNLRWEIGSKILYASYLAELANIPVWRVGDLARARSHLDEALAISEEQNVSYVHAKILQELTTHRLIEGKYDEALKLTEEVLELAPSFGLTSAWASFQRGIVFLALGDIDNASRFMVASLSRLIEWGWSGLLRTFLPFLGMILHEQGEHERAAELLAFGLSHPYSPGRLEVDPLIIHFRAELEESLGGGRFASAWERGKGLDTLVTAVGLLEDLEAYGP